MGDVLVRQAGACGRITLNRPAALNALTLEMTRVMYEALRAWAEDASVAFVLVDGAGERGLCAGGDVRALYGYAVSGDFTAAGTFLREEYRLNALIARYPKPYVALMDGVVMGGGVGISAHGSHRVVTERTVLAMPEVGIGFVPDVGGTYLLSKVEGGRGMYMALTGARVGAADGIACGFADVFVASDRLQALEAELVVCPARAELDACLLRYAAEAPPGRLAEDREWIAECFEGQSVEEVIGALRGRSEAKASVALGEILRNSPTAVKVAMASLIKSRECGDLVASLMQEYTVGMASIRDGDFCEGVRAALIDKDRRPQWKPATLAEVSAERVSSFFDDARDGRKVSEGWFGSSVGEEI